VTLHKQQSKLQAVKGIVYGPREKQSGAFETNKSALKKDKDREGGRRHHHRVEYLGPHRIAKQSHWFQDTTNADAVTLHNKQQKGSHHIMMWMIMMIRHSVISKTQKHLDDKT